MAVPNMGVPNLQINPFQPGATRFFELTFPRFGIVRSTAGFPALEANTRGGQTLTTAMNVTASGTGAQGGAFYKNKATSTLVCPAGADVSAVNYSHDITPFVDRLGNDPIGYPLIVYRYIFALGYPNIGGAIAAGKDFGIVMSMGNQTLLNSTRAGVVFGPRDNNTIGLGIRRVNAGGYTVDLTATLADSGIADLTDINIYELRMINANGSRNGLFSAYINGRQFGPAVDMGASANLFPNLNADGSGFLGYRFGVVVNALGFAYTLHIAQMHCEIGPIADDGY